MVLKVAYLLPEHAESLGILNSVDDVDAFIDALLKGPHDRNCGLVFSMDRPRLPSGYFDHELSVGVDRVAGVGVMALQDDGNYASRGSVDRGILEYMLMGHVREFAEGSEISIDLIRQAVREFLLNGGRQPSCIDWKNGQF